MDGQNRAAFLRVPYIAVRGVHIPFVHTESFHGALLLLFTNNQQGAAAVR